MARRACESNRVVVLARQASNRFLVSLKGLQIRALALNPDPQDPLLLGFPDSVWIRYFWNPEPPYTLKIIHHKIRNSLCTKQTNQETKSEYSQCSGPWTKKSFYALTIWNF
jgi:hypothetical protein